MNKQIDPRKALRHYGLKDDPFGKAVNPQEIFYSKRITEMLRSVEFFAVRGNICAIAGEPGCGKTTFVNALEARMKNNRRAVVARLCLPDGRKTTVSAHVYMAIEHALRNYGVGKLPVNWYARKEWCRRALGDTLAKVGKTMILVVDEAHQPHANFYKDVKILTEMEWAGSPVPLGVVLVGESNLKSKLELYAGNVWKRIVGKNTLYEFIRLGALETQRYLNRRARVAGHTGGVLFTAKAATAISRSAEDMLDINTLAWDAMITSYLMGDARVDGKHVLAGKSLMRIKQEYRLSVAAIAAKTKWSPTTVSAVLEQTYAGSGVKEKTADINDAMQKIIFNARSGQGAARTAV